MANGNLPEHWISSTLSDTCNIILGQSPSSDTYNAAGIGLPFYQGKAEFGDLYPTTVKWCSRPGKIAEAGDILISVRAPVGPTDLCQEKSCIGRGLAALRPRNGMPNKYLLYYLRFIENEWDSKATGTTFRAITSNVLRQQEIPIAPQPEQERIVARIEELFTRLDAGKAALRRVEAALKRYKASVLKAACEGRLVPQDPNDEPAEMLLRKILLNRKSEWELSARSKSLYAQPPSIDTMTELPSSWAWASLEQLTSATRVICYGILMPKEDFQNGIPYVKVKNLKDDKVDLENLNRTSPAIAKKYARASLKARDLLLAIRGTYGRVAITPPALEGGNITQDTARLVVSELADHEYIAWYLRSDFAQNYFKRVARGVAVKGVNIADVRQCPVALPPLSEQRRIVAEVERRLSVAREVEAVVAKSLARAARLRQAVLRSAFEGRL